MGEMRGSKDFRRTTTGLDTSFSSKEFTSSRGRYQWCLSFCTPSCLVRNTCPCIPGSWLCSLHAWFSESSSRIFWKRVFPRSRWSKKDSFSTSKSQAQMKQTVSSIYLSLGFKEIIRKEVVERIANAIDFVFKQKIQQERNFDFFDAILDRRDSGEFQINSEYIPLDNGSNAHSQRNENLLEPKQDGKLVGKRRKFWFLPLHSHDYSTH